MNSDESRSQHGGGVLGPPDSVSLNSRAWQPRYGMVPWYFAIAVFAVIVRAVYLLELKSSPFLSVLMVDARQYDEWAQRIAGGNWLGNEVFYQAPFYPYFLAAVYKFFGHDTWMVRVVQLLIGSASCVLVSSAGARFFSPGVGIVAGFLLALYAPAIFFGAIIQKAVLGLFFMALLLALTAKLLVSRRWWLLVLCGAVLGCFSITRENALILVPIVVLWLIVHFRSEPFRERMRSCLLLGVGLALILLPVGLRNQIVGGEFLLTTSQLGPNFYIGNNKDADGRTAPMRPRRDDPRFERQDSIEIAEADAGRKLTTAEVSSYWLNRSWEYIRSNPGHWCRLLVKKWFLLCNRAEIMDAEAIEAYEHYSFVLRGLGYVFHFGVLLPLAALGLWLTRHQAPRLWLLYGIGAAVALSVTIFFINARYRIPLIPILVLFAASGLHWMLQYRGQPGVARAAPGLILALIVAAVANVPKSPQADPVAITFANLGTAFAAQGRNDKALHFYKEAIKRIPALEAAHFGAGRVASDRGLLEEAEAHYSKAVELRPDYFAAHNELGIVLRAQGKLADAIRHYEKAIELYPQYANAHCNLGNAYTQLGRYEEALLCYQKSVALDASRFEVHFNQATLLEVMGRKNEAVQHLERALAIDAENPLAHFVQGRILAGLGQKQLALHHLTTSTRLDTDNPAAYNALGLVLASLGRLEEAQSALRTALRLKPDYADARENLTRVNEGMARGAKPARQ